MAMAVFGMTVMVAPILGPTLGGWITETTRGGGSSSSTSRSACWPWRLVHCAGPRPGVPGASCGARPAEARLRVDWVGIGLLVLGFACLETVLSKGEQWDWFGDPFGRVQVLAAGAALGLGGVVAWSLWNPDAVIDVRVFQDRNFAACSAISVCVFGVLYGTLMLLPGMLQSLMGYDALNAGLVMSPSGLAAFAMLPVVGWLLGQRSRRPAR